MKVSTSILSCDFSNLGSQILNLDKSGTDLFHFDVMDGRFVPNISFGPSIIKSVRNVTKIEFEVHLMIVEPFKYINDYLDCGVDILIFHLESNSNILECIKYVKKFNKKVGVAIKPKTNLDLLYPFFFDLLDIILVMTVEPGFGGQKFIENQIEKIKKLKKKIEIINKDIIIEVDGGINEKTALICKNLGVDICVAGTFVLNSSDFKKQIEIIHKI
ncbi:MAG: ribulose-phosphate 3-epimerase [Candidatus Improbicoccus pseudotrichonymphae]|uniref:Ribulose-phosphate 3-epimerase n=1 Tax=Candidatus Improbicoccus pseudotrichonymphae TaxID=3033792 RepID=A0AA48HVP6_9FIRM|nr:MAG: ribulose-phosphate 3-epimerase [Candidatus Improbicoccus pseudotrichonymphae]